MDTSENTPTVLLPSEERYRRTGLGITWKIFLATAAVVAIAIGGAIGWSSLRVKRLMEEATRSAFGSTELVFANLQAARYDRLKRMNAFVAEDVSFKAVVLETDEATQKDDLPQRRDALGADLAIVTDVHGKTLARTDGMGSRGEDLSQWPIVERALAGRADAGLLSQGGRLYNAVASPIGVPGSDFAGVLISGFALGQGVADDMKKTTGTDVAFVALEAGQPSVAASTLKAPEEIRSLLDLAGHAPEAGSGPPEQREIAGVPYLASVSPLVTADKKRAGALVVMRSIAAELATLRRLQTSLVGVGVLALFLALLASFLIARRITGPLLGLVRVAESVKDGKYEVQVPSGSGDEVGALASAIRSMVRELKDKAELERYVAELGGDPDRPTMAVGATQSSRTTMAGSAAKAGAPAPGAEPQVGDVVASRYEILEVLGAGGMGKVYRARDRELDEIVAMKTIRKELLAAEPGILERFKQEIKLARKATHKNVMRTFDFGDAQGLQYLTMEYVKGLMLRDLVRKQFRAQKEIPLGISLRIARQICEGLYAAHQAGIIHRDVKSQNILIQPNGEVKIMDFGIARPTQASGLTMAGAVVGTPEYMSPEQARGKDADFRSDVYSAGMVFYELFTGKLPFAGGNAMEIVMRHLQNQAPAPREVNPALPPSIDAVIRRMIEKDPASRFQSFKEVYAALARIPAPEAKTAAAA